MSWHLDRRVPIAMVLTMLLQIGALVWWAAHVDAQVLRNSATIATLERGRDDMTNMAITMARIEERLAGIDKRLARMERP